MMDMFVDTGIYGFYNKTQKYIHTGRQNIDMCMTVVFNSFF